MRAVRRVHHAASPRAAADQPGVWARPPSTCDARRNRGARRPVRFAARRGGVRLRAGLGRAVGRGSFRPRNRSQVDAGLEAASSRAVLVHEVRWRISEHRDVNELRLRTFRYDEYQPERPHQRKGHGRLRGIISTERGGAHGQPDPWSRHGTRDDAGSPGKDQRGSPRRHGAVERKRSREHGRVAQHCRRGTAARAPHDEDANERGECRE